MDPKSEAKAAEDEGPTEGMRMKQGAYRVHVFIEEARSLIPPDSKETTDPVFLVTVFGSSKSTKEINDVGSTSTIPINEHIFIDAENISSEEVSSQRLTIAARDQSLSLFTKTLIGVHEVDLTYIYSLPDHAMLHKWIVLSNPEENNYQQMRGYLKIGISLLHEEDKPVDLNRKEDPNSKDKDLMVPPYLKPKTIQLMVQLVKAENLPIMDKGETVDAYCVARFAGAECKSSTFTADKATLSAYWYDEMYLPVMVPCVTSSLTLNFWDYDTLSKDDVIGTVIINFDNVMKGKYQKYFWSNIYGAPPLAEGEDAEYMNRVPSVASHWRGRVLLRVWVEEKVKETYKKCIKIADPEISVKIRDEFETGQEYEMRTQIYSASALPIRKGKFSIRVEWSGVGVQSGVLETKNGCIDWFETTKRQITMIPKDSEFLLPDVFIYLVYEEQKICFTRIPAKEFKNRAAYPVWRQMVPEKSVGKVKEDWNAGYVKVRVYIGPYDIDNDDPATDNWKRVKKPDFENWTLYTHLFQCRGLPAADKNGLADPYLTVYCNGSEASTKDHPIESTLNPRWYETLVQDVSILSLKDSAPIILYIYDHDAIDADDIMGVSVVEMTEATIDAEIAPRPKWRPLGLGRKGTEKGEILVSFSLVNQSREKVQFNIMPEFEDKNIDLNILGLRDLKSAVAWLPVNKAFVRFDLMSLALPGDSQGITKIETQPFDSGSDPNITTTISFKCKMPRDKIYAPTLTSTVHDYLFAGLSQPLIGSFGIDLARYHPSNKKAVIKLAADLTKIKGKRGAMKILLPKMEDIKEEEEEEKEKASEPQSFIKRGEVEMKKGDAKESELTLEEVCADSSRIVVNPVFEAKGKNKKVEVRIPNTNMYLPIGYNRDPDDNKKSYRYYIHEPLDSTFLFSDLPFEEFDIVQGQSRGADDSFFSFGKTKDISGESTTLEKVGKFKATIRMTEFPAPQVEDEFHEIAKMLLNKTKCVIRVYIIDAFDLEAKDRGSMSDPYVKLKLAGKLISDRDSYQTDTCNPKIYKVFQLCTTLPGKSMLKVQFWDYNAITTDSKIGTTKIDLEDRFFNKKWTALDQKPIETRPLHVKSSRRPQGHVRLWVEIFTESKSLPEPYDISARPPAEFEARVIVWKAQDVPNMDPEGLSDTFVVVRLNTLPEKETDTHYRAARGRASWNWRMTFPIMLPQEANILTVQLWDKDILSGNDFISEASVRFDDIAKEAWEGDTGAVLLGESDLLKERILGKKSHIFWVQCKKRNDVGNEMNCGKVLISFEILPKVRASNSKVGEGRDDPNVNPFLPAPVGRFKFSMNPFSMLSQLVGPDIKWKICCVLCCILCCIMIVFMLPLVLSNGISRLIFGGGV